MYISDYLFAVHSKNWTKTGYSKTGESYDYRSTISSNWLYLGSDEWVITRDAASNYFAYYIYSSGRAGGYKLVSMDNAVRPVFYLSSLIKYAGGSGKKTDPIRLSATTNVPVVDSFAFTATKNSLTLTAQASKGNYDITRYYFSIDGGKTYAESTTNTYTFTGLTAGTTYSIIIKVMDSSGIISDVYSSTAKTDSITLADICSSGSKLATCIKNFTNQGTDISKIYYHTTTLANGAGDGSYRYAGASSEVNNYVCINSNETTCSDANLFRIIGVFGSEVKLVKATSIGKYPWDSNKTTVWTNASLNTYLNGDYLTSLGTFASNYIVATTLKVGGNTYANIKDAVPAAAYKNEITTPAVATTVSKQIGLMFASDYGFAAYPAAWVKTLGEYYSYINGTLINVNNWLYSGEEEWLITPTTDYNMLVNSVDDTGGVIYKLVSSSYAVRPTFYLNSNVTYKSGTGAYANPIRLG